MRMEKPIESKIYPVKGLRIDRIDVHLMYFSKLRRYYVSVYAHKIKEQTDDFISTTAYTQYFLLHQVTRRTKKQDKIALDRFLLESGGLAEQMAKRFDAVLEV